MSKSRLFASPRLVSLLIALSFLSLGATARPASSGTSPPPSRKAAAARKAPAAKHVLPFIDDDLARALAEARKTNRPVFVESWAPW